MPSIIRDCNKIVWFFSVGRIFFFFIFFVGAHLNHNNNILEDNGWTNQKFIYDSSAAFFWDPNCISALSSNISSSHSFLFFYEESEKIITEYCTHFKKVHPRLDLVNVVVRPFLFTILSLFTKSILVKE